MRGFIGPIVTSLKRNAINAIASLDKIKMCRNILFSLVQLSLSRVPTFIFAMAEKIKCVTTFFCCTSQHFSVTMSTRDVESWWPAMTKSEPRWSEIPPRIGTRKWSNLTRNGVRSASQGGRIALFSPSRGGETEPGNPSFGGQDPENGRFWGPGGPKTEVLGPRRPKTGLRPAKCPLLTGFALP